MDGRTLCSWLGWLNPVEYFDQRHLKHIGDAEFSAGAGDICCGLDAEGGEAGVNEVSTVDLAISDLGAKVVKFANDRAGLDGIDGLCGAWLRGPGKSGTPTECRIFSDDEPAVDAIYTSSSWMGSKAGSARGSFWPAMLKLPVDFTPRAAR